MKKQILVIITIMAFSFIGKAQTKEQVINNFKNLLTEAASDFKNVKGKLLEDDAGRKTAYYSCGKTLGSSFEAICINSGDSTTYYSSKFEYEKTPELIKATEILPGILDVINAMIKSGKYTGRDYKKDNAVDMTEVKDLQGNYIVEIESRSDTKSTDKNYLMIVIYGKSWGTK
jgi:predicted metal-dependent RNase